MIPGRRVTLKPHCIHSVSDRSIEEYSRESAAACATTAWICEFGVRKWYFGGHLVAAGQGGVPLEAGAELEESFVDLRRGLVGCTEAPGLQFLGRDGSEDGGGPAVDSSIWKHPTGQSPSRTAISQTRRAISAPFAQE